MLKWLDVPFTLFPKGADGVMPTGVATANQKESTDERTGKC